MAGYKSTAEMAEKWGISQSDVSILCRTNMLPGAIKVDNKWKIPENAIYDSYMLKQAKYYEKEQHKIYKNAKTTAEMSKKWGIPQNDVALLCRKNMIPGAKKIDKKWKIPEDAIFDPDKLKEAKNLEKELHNEQKENNTLYYKQSEPNKNNIYGNSEIEGSGCLSIILLVIIIIFCFVMCDGGNSSYSSSSSEPWKDLGVSEREYKQVYNYYKYGEWS